MASAVSSPATGEGDSSGSGEDRDGITLESLQKLQRFFGKDRALNETEFVEKVSEHTNTPTAQPAQPAQPAQ